MAADYDLVILGGTLEGRYAAAAAAGYGARVALVEPPGVFVRRQRAKYLLQGLQQLGEGRQRQAVREWFDLSDARPAQKAADFDWLGLLQWSAIAAETQHPALSTDILSAKGIDAIFATPERLSRQLVVTVADRQLSTRAVLAAFGSVPLPVFDLSADHGKTPALTGIERLLDLESLPQRVSVWGNSLEAVEWAQALCEMGVSVSLVTDDFLPDEDSEVKGWVRSQLTATGIQLTDSSTAFETHAQSLPCASLLLGRTQPALILPNFVYRSAGRDRNTTSRTPERTHLRANQHLQTAHPRVFACGSILHGQSVGDLLAQTEAQTAVWNALFVPNKRVTYDAIPHSHRRFARVGRTPRFAKEGYTPTGDYTVWTATSANSADLCRPLPLPSYCKLICQKGRLQSIHLIGDRADQLAPSLSATIGQPVHQLLGFANRTPASSVGEGLVDLLHSAASQSQQSRWQPYHWRRDWAENWFNWRRSR